MKGFDGFVDREAIQGVMETIIDPLRERGVHLDLAHVQFQIAAEGVVAVAPLLILPSAKEKALEDKETKQEFLAMMEQSKVDRLAKEAEEARLWASSGFDEEAIACPHLNRHPYDNFCLDCQAEL